MKTITLTSNEVLTLIAEGMTMYNCQSLANKLRNADAPMPAIHPSNAAYHDALKQVEILKQNQKLANQQLYDAMVDLEKAKQTETKLRAEIQNWANEAKQDNESLKYFRKWVEELRVAMDADKGLTTAAVFSDAVSCVKEYKTTAELLKKTERNLEKANNVIAAVKLLCDHRGYDMQLHDIKNNVENYYRDY